MHTEQSFIAIDTDPGIDDALALMFAFSAVRDHPRYKIPLITTVGGNVPLSKVTENARRILDLAAPSELPSLVRGAARPLRRRLVSAADVHGDDGLGGITQIATATGKLRYRQANHIPIMANAARALNAFARRYAEAATIVALGPLTNIARALMADPQALRQIRQLVVMGGSIAAGGNVTAAAEYNFYADPDAADLVLSSGLNITLVPLDVTHQLALTPELLDTSIGSRRGKRITAVRDMTKRLFDERGVLHLHDPLAVMVALDPSLVGTERYSIRIDTASDLSLGASIADRRPSAATDFDSKIEVATRVAKTKALDFFLKHLLDDASSSSEESSKPRIVVAGGSNIDWTLPVRKLPSVGETTVGGRLREDFGGKAANQAIAAARAGARPTMLGRVGDDEHGSRIRSHLAANAVEVDSLLATASQPSGLALILVDELGNNMIAVSPGANEAFAPSDVHTWPQQAQILVACLEAPLPTLETLFERAKANGARTLLNASPVTDDCAKLFPLVDVLVVNEVEAAQLAYQDESSTSVVLQRPRAAAAKLSLLGPSDIIITLGAKGAYAYSSGKGKPIPATKTEVVDTVGAGDTFLGFFAHALASGEHLASACEIACVAASLSVSRPGAQNSIPTMAEVQVFSRRRQLRS